MNATATLPAQVVEQSEPSLNEMLALDIPRAARVLTLTEKTLRRRIADGTVPVVKIGRLVRVPVDALRKLLNGEQPQK